jgi:hypothetical protein
MQMSVIRLGRYLELAQLGQDLGDLQLVVEVGFEAQDVLTLAMCRAVRLPALGQRLISPIAAALRELGADAVTFVPCGLLGTLPLHAAPYPAEGTARRLIDEFDVSYCPSARVLASARSRLAAASADSAALAGVANPPSPQPLE